MPPQHDADPPPNAFPASAAAVAGVRRDLTVLPRLLADDPGITAALGRSSAVLAVPEPARAITVAALAEESQRSPILLAVPTTLEAERITRDLGTWLGGDAVEHFPAWETLPFERVSPATETMGQRLRVIWRLLHPEGAGERHGGPLRVVVAPVRALVQRLGPHVEDMEPLVIGAGDTVDSEELVERLVSMGYRREYQVEHRGEIAVRGSIVDLYPSTADAPIRIDLWGDEVDRLSEFSVADQRSVVDLAEVLVFPCRELLPTDEVRERAAELVAAEPWGREQWERIAEGLTFDGMESWLPWLAPEEHVITDLVGGDGLVLLAEPRRLLDRATDILAEEADLAATLARTWGAVEAGPEGDGQDREDREDREDGEGGEDDPAAFPRLHLDFDRLLALSTAPVWTLTTVPEGPGVATVEAMGWATTHGEDGGGLIRQVRGLLDDGYRVVVAADGAGSAARLVQLFSEQGIRLDLDESGAADLTRPGAHVVVAPLERGTILPSARLAVLAEGDVTGRRRSHRKARPRRTRASGGFFDDLRVGDHVVHHQHGVARYGGMVTRAIGGVDRDYLLLEYRGDDKLYVPSDQIDAVTAYNGGDSPTLSKLGGSDWQRTRAKVRSEVAEIAQELVVLYQRRVTSTGRAFSPDTPWQAEMEDAFPYELTADQAKAVEEIKADMESEVPMDRLLCGDVGFGKTEVAIRAVFKAVQDGVQVAVLAPTTLLANQHGQVFAERFAGYPVRVEVLSRFLTNAQAKKVVDGVASGEVDVVIGTHRLLSQDIRFKDLGLLVVDEEQRFGVSHKEQIKRLKADVDVLTLTATPIPRTLEMSLTGIRDLTLLQTPPAERQPILTYVGEHDERAIGEAIRRELLREGQVFFVHNRVRDIERTAARIRDLVPEARVAIAHGQMDEGSLEQVVLDFWEGEYDVLVCTTIIESGIDMPTVNTLVVDRADLLGLGQLHQLRGRVGRAGSRAYAYLFFPPDRELSEEAYERLKTIGEATELGSGFRIAMRDLEIRGAGNLLGTGQSGHIAAVGYDLYVQMVNEAVAELQGEVPDEPADIAIDVPLDAHLPSDYIEREDLRLEAYRRLAAVATPGEVDDVRSEWTDRFGPPPAPVEALLSVARLRAECVRVGVKDVTVTRGTGIGGPKWVARIEPIELKASKVVRMERLYRKAVYKADQRHLQLPIKDVTRVVDELVAAFEDLVPGPEAPAAAS